MRRSRPLRESAFAAPDRDREENGTPRISRSAQRYADLVYRLRWLILTLWSVGLVAALPEAARLSSVLRGGGFQIAGSESNQVDQLLQSRLHAPASQVMIVFQSSQLAVQDHTYQRELAGFSARARGLSHVTGVQKG
jgi:hypothetical protein